METRRIKRALISVYHKDGIKEIAQKLKELNVEICSTGGTYDFLKGEGIAVTAVEDLTGYPSILGGRVKTLHPAIFGGILGRRDNSTDIEHMEKYNIAPIDLIIVDLYPFEQYVASKADHSEIIEKIDIGGISLIRAAAKNYKDVIIVPCKELYSPLMQLLNSKGGESTLDERFYFAAEAFNISSNYDTAIFNYFNEEIKIPSFKKSVMEYTPLRYGENPHQKAVYYGSPEGFPAQLHGKEISYNNLLDIEAALELISDFNDTTVAILKHNNACGCASRESVKEAWEAALNADPVSAFGGIIISNRKIDLESANEMNKIFFEVVIAPEYDPQALEILKSKKNRIILIAGDNIISKEKFRSMFNGVLVQDRDSATESIENLKIVTSVAPTADQSSDLIFANKLVKHSKSNAIVLAKNKTLIASGIGQTSRVDALKQAIEKAGNFGFSLEGSVMASDAFFPFPDCVEIAHKAGVTSVIQPGGSVRDQESVDYCNANGLAMVVTGTRHFKH